MKCPTCGNEEAYLGMFDVDCPNPDCRHYKEDAVQAPVLQQSPQDGSQQFPQVPQAPVAIANLTVKIVNATPKRTTVEIAIQADGDPGYPDKKVQLEFWVPGVIGKTPCTLSHRGGSHILSGIDANGTSIYTTHWKCAADGVAPSDPWKLEAKIFP